MDSYDEASRDADGGTALVTTTNVNLRVKDDTRITIYESISS
jgi:hypothetical protein